MPEFLITQWQAVALDTTLKGLLLFLAAGGALLTLRHASAAARHLVWRLTIGGLLVLPLLSQTLPPLQCGFGSADRGATLHDEAPTAWRTLSPGGHRAPAPPEPSRAGAEPRGAAATSRSWAAWLFVLWGVGVVAVLGRVLAGLLRVERIGRRRRRVSAAPLAPLVSELARGSDLRRPVFLLESAPDEATVVPMTWGFVRPIVLLPAGATAWPEERLRAVLLHELAHAKRGDWLAQVLAHVVCALYWFHPLVWWAAGRLRLESERACDDHVLAAGVNAAEYAHHLLELARTLGATRAPVRAAVTIAQGPRIEERLHAILDGDRPRGATTRRASAAALAAAMGLVVPLAAVRVGAEPSPTVSRARSMPRPPGPIRVRAAAPGVASLLSPPHNHAATRPRAPQMAKPVSPPTGAPKPLLLPPPPVSPPRPTGGSRSVEPRRPHDETRPGARPLLPVPPRPTVERERQARLPLAGASRPEEERARLREARLPRPASQEVITIQTEGSGAEPRAVDRQAIVARNGTDPPAGNERLTVDERVRAGALGVDAAFIREIKEAGYDRLTVDQLVSMGIQRRHPHLHPRAERGRL